MARCGDAGRLLRGQHGPDFGRSPVECLRSALADPHDPAELPPPKFVFAESAPGGRRGHALDSIVCSGSIVSAAGRAVAARPNCRVNSYATVEDSILFGGVDIGRHAKVRRAIIDKGVHIPPGMQIGFDLDEDRERGFTISDEGLVVIAKPTGPSIFKMSSRRGDRALPSIFLSNLILPCAAHR